MKKIILLSFIFVVSFLFVPKAFAEFSSVPNSTSCSIGGTVYAVAKGADGTTYIGGSFSTVCGQTRNGIAAFDSSGVLTSWNPDANDGWVFLSL